MMLACIAKEEFETEMEMEHAIALKTARHEHNQNIYTYHYYISTTFQILVNLSHLIKQRRDSS